MTIQTTYGGAPERARRGQIQRYEYIKGEMIALENLEPDVEVVYGGNPAEKNKIRKRMQTQNVLQADINLEASNSTVGTVTVTGLDGTATETVLTPTVYASSHADTLAAIAAKIAAIDGVKSATADATAKTITILADGDYHIDLSAFATTLGSNQAEWSYAPGSADKTAGFVTNLDSEPNDDGYAYLAGDTVKVMIRGRVSVLAAEAITTADTLRARFRKGNGINEHRGVLCTTEGDPAVAAALSPDIALQTPAGAGGIADLELNLIGA